MKSTAERIYGTLANDELTTDALVEELSNKAEGGYEVDRTPFIEVNDEAGSTTLF